MSFMMFQQECGDCHEKWNAAFGIVGTTFIAQPPVKCPKCGSTNILKFADGWKLDDGSIYGAGVQNDKESEGPKDNSGQIPTPDSDNLL